MFAAIAPGTAKKRRLSGILRFGLGVCGFCLLLLAGLWWFVVQQIAFEQRRAVDDAVRQNVNRTIAFEQFVRRTLDSAELVSRYYADRFATGTPPEDWFGTRRNPGDLRNSFTDQGLFLGVSIADARGDLIATSLSRPQLPLANVSSHPAFRVHVERGNGRLFVSPPAYSRVFRQPIIWLSRRLENPDGSFAGVVAINIAPAQFTAFYRDASINPTDVMSVIGLDGITRARRTGNQESYGEDLRGRLVMREQMRNPNGTYVGPSALDGMVRYFSHRRLREYDLFATYGVLEAQILAEPRRRAAILIAGSALASLLLIAFAAFLIFNRSRQERRTAELARANERLHEAQRIGQIGDWDYDVRTGELKWSPQLCVQFERDPAQGGPTFDEFKAYLDEEGRAAIDRANAEAMRTGEAQEVEYDVRMPSGLETRHQSVVIPTFDEDGKVVRLHGTSQNISARQLLDKLQTQVAHLSRVEAMNAMAATLAHELNQPLAAASNFLVGSRRRLRTSSLDEVEQGMLAAERQVQFAGTIIRRVREMVANQPKTPARVSLSRLIDDAAALVVPANSTSSLRLVQALDPDAQQVFGDRIQLQQVLVNLLRNACDSVAAQEHPVIEIGSRCEPDGAVTVWVEDNGPGFPEGKADRFSPFATTKEAGLGLGLSISRTIIEAHGGRIWIEDRQQGKGARVCFTLPPLANTDQPGAATIALPSR